MIDHPNSNKSNLSNARNNCHPGPLSLIAKIESLIFASQNPISVSELFECLSPEGVSVESIKKSLLELLSFYCLSNTRGFYLKHVDGVGYQFRTHEDTYYLLEKVFASRPRPLSRAAQETLAIIAYRQPTTRADIEFIRGVDAGSILKNLLERDFIKCVGRRDDAGRAMLFSTTQNFLTVYGLSSLSDLPPIEAFQPSLETLSKSLQKMGIEDVNATSFLNQNGDSL